VVAHGFAFLVFALLAVSSALATGDRARRIACLRTLAPSFALAGWAAYRERASALPAGSVDAKNPALTAYFQGPLDKLSLLATPTLMTRWGLDALVGVLLWLVLSAAVLETERGLRRERLTRDKADPPDRHARALLVCLAVLAVAFLALPHAIGWLAFVDGRLVPVLLFVGILSVRRASLRPWVRRAQDRAAPVAAWAMVAIVLVASRWFQAEALGFREVLLRVPAGAKLLHLPIDPDSDVFTAHPFLHYDKLILTERPVLVSDAWFHQGTGVYPTAANPSTRLPPSYVASDLRVVDWPAYRLEDWDYILVRTRPAAPAPAVPVALTLVVHEGGFWLFRVAPGPSFVTYSAERP
jgi:hypothetical protein